MPKKDGSCSEADSDDDSITVEDNSEGDVGPSGDNLNFNTTLQDSLVHKSSCNTVAINNLSVKDVVDSQSIDSTVMLSLSSQQHCTVMGDATYGVALSKDLCQQTVKEMMKPLPINDYVSVNRSPEIQVIEKSPLVQCLLSHVWSTSNNVQSKMSQKQSSYLIKQSCENQRWP